MLKIPADFPKQPPMGAVTGVQPKILARKLGDRYVAGWTEEELRLRFENCEDLAQQFANYCRRKAKEHPEWTLEFNLQRAAAGLAQKVCSGTWDVTPEEQAWIVCRLRKVLVGNEISRN